MNVTHAFDRAILLIKERNYASITMFQRRLGIGYEASKDLLRRLEFYGFIKKSNSIEYEVL